MSAFFFKCSVFFIVCFVSKGNYFHQFPFVSTNLLLCSFYSGPWEINFFTIFHNRGVKNKHQLLYITCIFYIIKRTFTILRCLSRLSVCSIKCNPCSIPPNYSSSLTMSLLKFILQAFSGRHPGSCLLWSLYCPLCAYYSNRVINDLCCFLCLYIQIHKSVLRCTLIILMLFVYSD